MHKSIYFHVVCKFSATHRPIIAKKAKIQSPLLVYLDFCPCNICKLKFTNYLQKSYICCVCVRKNMQKILGDIFGCNLCVIYKKRNVILCFSCFGNLWLCYAESVLAYRIFLVVNLILQRREIPIKYKILGEYIVCCYLACISFYCVCCVLGNFI